MLLEFKFVIDFDSIHLFHIEDDPIQMDDQGVRQFLDNCLFYDINFLLAIITSKVTNDLAFDEIFQSFSNIVLRLHFY